MANKKAKSISHIFISFSPDDYEKVIPIIDTMAAHGYRVWYENINGEETTPEITASRLAEAECVMTFITESYVKSQKCRRELTFAQDKQKDLIDVYLENVKLSDGMMMQLGLNQAIYKERYANENAFYEELFNTNILKDFKNKPKKKAESAKAAESPLPTSKKEEPKIPSVSLINLKIPSYVMVSYGAIAPLVMHFTSLNYSGFWSFVFYNSIPLIILSLLSSLLRKLSPDVDCDSLLYGIFGLLIALVVTPFFVHTTEVVILKILITVGLNLIPAFVSLIILSLNEVF